MTAPQFAHTTLSKPTRVTPRLCTVPRQLASVPLHRAVPCPGQTRSIL
jgi:hypothetical protein